MMRGKPIVIYNRLDESTGQRFWEPLIRQFQGLCQRCDFTVAERRDEILPLVREGLKRS